MKEIFFEAFFSLVRLFLHIQDDFFKQKLVKKTKELFVSAAQSPFPNNVAQSGQKETLKLTDDLNELVEIMIHLKLVSLSPALMAQKDILLLRVEIMNAVSPEEQQTRRPTGRVAPFANKLVQKSLQSKELIVNFLKNQFEGMSAAEIAEGLRPRLSRRTIHRQLNSLIKTSQIKKTNTDGLPKYSTYPH